MISNEQAKQIRDQLFEQMKSWPEEQKASAMEQIESMNNEELEQFLVKNNLVKKENNISSKKDEVSPFRLIVEGKIPAYKIGENKVSLAVLEINPITKGHCIIISKK